MADPYSFSCDNWVSADKLPNTDHVLLSARALLSSTSTWKRGRRFHRGLVSSLSRREKGVPGWYVRVSEHTKAGGVGFGDLWWALGVDHSLHEAEYVPELKQATRLRVFEEGRVEAWSLYYTFPPPISPRTFCVLLLIDPPSPHGDGEDALIVSLPYTPSAEEEKQLRKSIRGKYCSIERILLQKGTEGEKVEWRMATQSSAMGGIPGWVQEASVAGKIANDVPFVLKWLKTHPAPTPAAPAPAVPAKEPEPVAPAPPSKVPGESEPAADAPLQEAEALVASESTPQVEETSAAA